MAPGIVVVPCTFSGLFSWQAQGKPRVLVVHDRCRRSERLTVDVWISRQAQYFGHDDDGCLRRALIL